MTKPYLTQLPIFVGVMKDNFCPVVSRGRKMWEKNVRQDFWYNQNFATDKPLDCKYEGKINHIVLLQPIR